MPYCPKCDMEFIEGIAVCSDCGGALAESKKAAAALQQEQELELELEKAGQVIEENEEKTAPPPVARAYVTKAQQYDDLKSSASAFYLIGGFMVAGSALCWLGLVRLPFAGSSRMLSQSIMTILGLVSLYVGFSSGKSAKVVHSQIDDEEMTTRQLIQWFVGSYSADQLDQQIIREYGELSPEEHSLKRFALIEDMLITNHALDNQSYVDSLAEEIYGEVFPD